MLMESKTRTCIDMYDIISFMNVQRAEILFASMYMYFVRLN